MVCGPGLQGEQTGTQSALFGVKAERIALINFLYLYGIDSAYHVHWLAGCGHNARPLNMIQYFMNQEKSMYAIKG